jgi:N-acetylmuramoyl-L-alanine amidase
MRKCILIAWILCFALTISISHSEETMSAKQILKGKKICIDPGHGGTAGKDMFRQGPTGEREEWINLRVGLLLKDLLEQAGATVVITRTKDKFMELKDRADMAIKAHCDLFISIHHNGTAQDNETNFPLVFYFKNAGQNPASVDFAKILVKHIQEALGLPEGEIYSDWTILPNSGTAVLRYTNPYMPGVIGEASFFTNPDEEQRLKQNEYNQKETQAYLDAITDYFSKGIPSAELIEPKPKQPITEKRPNIQFQLSDGLGGKAIDPNSIRVNWNGQYIGKSYQAKTGVVTVLPTDFCYGDQTIKVFARNTNGQALHPQTYILKTAGALAKSLESQKKELAKSSAATKEILALTQIEPKPESPLNEKSPKIILDVEYMNHPTSLDTASFEIYFNHRKIPYQYDTKHQRIHLSALNLERLKTETLVIFSAKDIQGREFTITPDSFTFKLSSFTTQEKNEYQTDYEKGAKIIEEFNKDTVKKNLSADEKETLLKGIDDLTRSIQLFAESPVSGKAQYLIGTAFEKLADDPYYKKQAIDAYMHTVEYYPGFETVPLAHAALRKLRAPAYVVPDLP